METEAMDELHREQYRPKPRRKRTRDSSMVFPTAAARATGSSERPSTVDEVCVTPSTEETLHTSGSPHAEERVRREQESPEDGVGLEHALSLYTLRALSSDDASVAAGLPGLIKFGVEGVRFGRDPGCCDIVLASTGISRIHCTLTVLGDEVCVLDRSSNGTFINGRRIGRGRSSLLAPSDVLMLINPTLSGAAECSYRFEAAGVSAGERQQSWHARLAEGMQRYDLGPSIGQGSFAVVRLAVDRETQEQVAIKILERRRFLSEIAFTSLHTEVEILRHMDHPHVVKVLDAFESAEAVALVMEYIPGGDLFDYIVGRSPCPFTEEEGRLLFLQLLEAVVYIHSQKVIHCDLKPENILVDIVKCESVESNHRNSGTEGGSPAESSSVAGAQSSPTKVAFSVADNHEADARSISPYNVCLKLTDFGIAKYRGEREEESEAAVVGTAVYAAPELLQDTPEGSDATTITSAVDIWSLGMLLYIMLSGALPKNAQRSMTVRFNKHMIDLSPECKDLISAMMAINPADRITLSGICQHPWLDGEQVMCLAALGLDDDALSVTTCLSPRFGRSLRPSAFLPPEAGGGAEGFQ